MIIVYYNTNTTQYKSTYIFPFFFEMLLFLIMVLESVCGHASKICFESLSLCIPQKNGITTFKRIYAELNGIDVDRKFDSQLRGFNEPLCLGKNPQSDYFVYRNPYARYHSLVMDKFTRDLIFRTGNAHSDKVVNIARSINNIVDKFSYVYNNWQELVASGNRHFIRQTSVCPDWENSDTLYVGSKKYNQFIEDLRKDVDGPLKADNRSPSILPDIVQWDELPSYRYLENNFLLPLYYKPDLNFYYRNVVCNLEVHIVTIAKEMVNTVLCRSNFYLDRCLILHTHPNFTNNCPYTERCKTLWVDKSHTKSKGLGIRAAVEGSYLSHEMSMQKAQSPWILYINSSTYIRNYLFLDNICDYLYQIDKTHNASNPAYVCTHMENPKFKFCHGKSLYNVQWLQEHLLGCRNQVVDVCLTKNGQQHTFQHVYLPFCVKQGRTNTCKKTNPIDLIFLKQDHIVKPTSMDFLDMKELSHMHIVPNKYFEQ